DSGRLLTGKVTGKQDQALVNAVVYLSNTRTRAVKSFIVGPDGVYRFPALSPNIDYEVYAQHEGHKSDTKTVSQFDTRPSVNINLKRQTMESVAQARAAAISAITISQKAQADLLLTGALRGLFAVAENYPQLKANDNFLRLQNRISELEERIADRREFFNDDVNTYNTRINQIPEVFLASFMGL